MYVPLCLHIMRQTYDILWRSQRAHDLGALSRFHLSITRSPYRIVVKDKIVYMYMNQNNTYYMYIEMKGHL